MSKPQARQPIDYDILIFLGATLAGGTLSVLGGVGTYLAVVVFAWLSIYMFTHNDEPED